MGWVGAGPDTLRPRLGLATFCGCLEKSNNRIGNLRANRRQPRKKWQRDATRELGLALHLPRMAGESRANRVGRKVTLREVCRWVLRSRVLTLRPLANWLTKKSRATLVRRGYRHSPRQSWRLPRCSNRQCG